MLKRELSKEYFFRGVGLGQRLLALSPQNKDERTLSGPNRPPACIS
jgi:hypothetical protein